MTTGKTIALTRCIFFFKREINFATKSESGEGISASPGTKALKEFLEKLTEIIEEEGYYFHTGV